MDLSLFDYDLPPERIAQEPAARRDAARLLVIDRAAEGVSHRRVAELPELLAPGDLVVVNDTRVVPARLFGVRKATGGKVEVLVLGPFDRPDAAERMPALVKTRGRLEPGERLQLDGGLVADVVDRPEGRDDGAFVLAFTVSSTEELIETLATAGTMPLPPYIERSRGDPRGADLDRERYQTIFAERPGAIAAPTAALHFSEAIIGGLDARGIGIARLTLHVGIGTFLPIRTDRVEDHPMQGERFEIPPETSERIEETRAVGHRIVAVGTTAVRSLEWWARTGETEGTTNLYVHPPFEFQVVDALLTNFHQPRSTPLLLASAFAGRERILAAYGEAIAKGYRLFSYGDATLLL